jgi:hypothetical protein
MILQRVIQPQLFIIVKQRVEKQTALQAGQYTCIVNSNVISVTVKPLPACSITPNTTNVCPNTTTLYTGSAGMTGYLWTIRGMEQSLVQQMHKQYQ